MMKRCRVEISRLRRPCDTKAATMLLSKITDRNVEPRNWANATWVFLGTVLLAVGGDVFLGNAKHHSQFANHTPAPAHMLKVRKLAVVFGVYQEDITAYGKKHG